MISKKGIYFTFIFIQIEEKVNFFRNFSQFDKCIDSRFLRKI
jgi:hypothetical protein